MNLKIATRYSPMINKDSFPVISFHKTMWKFQIK